MVIDFTYDEQYIKTYIPDALSTEVFNFYFGGFRDFKGKTMVLLRRQKRDAATELSDQVRLLYNGEERDIDEPFKMHVEGVVIDDYLNKDSWNVIITIPAVKIDGSTIEAVIPGVDFTDEELYGLDELKNGLSDFNNMQVEPEIAKLFGGFMGSVYIRLMDTVHKCKNTAYGTDRGLFMSIGEPVKLHDEGSYCVKVRLNGLFSGGQQAWLCRYPVGCWKENKTVFMEKIEGVSQSARGSRLNVGVLFDKKYIMPDISYEYRLFKITEG